MRNIADGNNGQSADGFGDAVTGIGEFEKTFRDKINRIERQISRSMDIDAAISNYLKNLEDE